ncbi:MAG TPA: extracellular solute-binding protein [Alphaproteobacteria bacterium]|nr:extracellular solute-binding protein [Alphaproteobacteria bacterium]
MMCRRLIPILAAIAALAWSGSARAVDQAIVDAAKKEGEVVWYTTLIIDQYVRPTVAGFEKKYPGIKVRYVRNNSTETTIKIINEAKAGKLQADLFDGTNTSEVLKKEGLVEAWKPDSAKDWPADVADPQGWWVATNVYVLTPGYNTDLIKPGTEPKTYDDLLDPKWKGKMVWNGSVSSSGGPGFVGNVLISMGQEKGMAYLQKLAGQRIANLDVSARQVMDQVIAGEYPLALQIFNHHTVISAKKGAPSAWIKMEPAMVVLQVASVAKGAAHPNAAKLLLDYMVSDEGQKFFRDADYLPASPRVEAPDPTLKPEGGHFKANVVSPGELEDRMPKWKQVFDQYFR